MKRKHKKILAYIKVLLLILAGYATFSLIKFYSMLGLNNIGITSEPTQYIAILSAVIAILILVYKLTPETAVTTIFGGGK